MNAAHVYEEPPYYASCEYKNSTDAVRNTRLKFHSSLVIATSLCTYGTSYD